MSIQTVHYGIYQRIFFYDGWWVGLARPAGLVWRQVDNYQGAVVIVDILALQTTQTPCVLGLPFFIVT